MDVKIKGIEMRAGYNREIEADIDFVDDDEVIKDFGAERCVKALDETELYEKLGGWENARKFYADAIDELLEKEASE
jgi:hypothetical protein